MNTIVKKTKGCSDSFLCILMKMLLSHRFEAKKVNRLNRESLFTSVLLIEIKAERIYNTSD